MRNTSKVGKSPKRAKLSGSVVIQIPLRGICAVSSLHSFDVTANAKKPLSHGEGSLRETTSEKHMGFLKITPTCIEWRDARKANERLNVKSTRVPRRPRLSEISATSSKQILPSSPLDTSWSKVYPPRGLRKDRIPLVSR